MEESEACDCSSESDDKQSWREDTGKFLCISLVGFTSLLQILK